MNSVKPISGRQAGEVCRLLEERGVDGDEFQSLFIEGIDRVMEWRDGLKLSKALDQTITCLITETLSLTVKYGETDEQIKAGGYSWKNNNITAKNFPTNKAGEVQLEAILVHSDKYAMSEQVVEGLDKLGLRAGDLDELLAIGVKYPDKQKEFPIVALGSVILLRGDHHVPGLSLWGGERRLDLGRRNDGWLGNFFRFLAFRK